jgi:hypothetical protein
VSAKCDCGVLTAWGEDVSAVLGTAGNPMSRDQVISKSRDLMVPVLGASAAAKLIERTLDLENVNSVSTVFEDAESIPELLNH